MRVGRVCKTGRTDLDFTGKTITVTGATKGIGRASAVYFAQKGAKVLALGRTESELESLRDEISCEIFPVDLNDPEQTRQVAQSLPVADHLFNNAGTVTMQSFLDVTVEQFNYQMNVNVLSALIMSQEFVKKLMAEGRTGSIVHMSSVSSTTAFDQHASYCAAKGAIDSLTTVMARELGPLGFRVNSVNPAVTMTPMAKKAWSDPEKSAGFLARIPAGRFIEPVEVASAVAFLMSDAASMVHGVMLPVDGGFLCT